MSYCTRGKYNSFDAYMAGFSPWITPRQILILATMCEKYEDEVSEGIEKEAFLDFKSQIDAEAKIKKKKYLEEL
jgi:hypothetical protein